MRRNKNNRATGGQRGFDVFPAFTLHVFQEFRNRPQPMGEHLNRADALLANGRGAGMEQGCLQHVFGLDAAVARRKEPGQPAGEPAQALQKRNRQAGNQGENGQQHGV